MMLRLNYSTRRAISTLLGRFSFFLTLSKIYLQIDHRQHFCASCMFFTPNPYFDMTYPHRMDLWWPFAIMPYGEDWKLRRRTFVQHFPPSDAHIHQPKETHFIRTRFLPQLVKSPDQFMDHVRQLVIQSFMVGP